MVDLGKDMVPTYPDVVVASEAAMTTQAAQLRAFLAASFKALDRMQHDQTFGLSYLKTYTSETNDKINQQVYEQIIRTQPANGEIKPEGIQNSVRIAGKAWGMDDLPKIDPMTVYTTKFLPGSKSCVGQTSRSSGVASEKRSSMKTTVVGTSIFAAQVAIAAAAAVAWEVVSRRGIVNPELLPPLSDVLATLWQLLHDPRFLADLRVTAVEVVVSFLIVAPSEHHSRIFPGRNARGGAARQSGLPRADGNPEIDLPADLYSGARHRLHPEDRVRRGARVLRHRRLCPSGGRLGAERLCHARPRASAPRAARSIPASICRRCCR